MSHIDDAHIEAYVDGAYDVLGPELVDEIERRVREDPELAARLQAARAARSAASEILSLAAPSPGPVPPFHELQERAAATAGPREEDPRRWVRIPPIVGLGWAATVVLALGVGWFFGQNGSAPASFQAPEMDAVGRSEAEGLPADRAFAPSTFEAQAEEKAIPAAEVVADLEDLSSTTASPPPAESPVAALGVRLDEADEDRVAQRALAEAVPPAEPETVPDAGRRVAEPAARERARPGELTRTPPLASEVAGNAVAAPAQLRQSSDQIGASVTAGGFANHPLHSLALPGLTVVAVGLKEEGALSGLEILHRLPTGDTLSLRYVGLFSETPEPLGVDEARATSETMTSISAQIQGAALPRGWQQVVVRKEDRWVVARAPISEGEIRAYLMTLN